MLIDTHAHLDMEDFSPDRREVIKRALNGGISRIITVGIDVESSRAALELARQYPDVFSAVGCHPHNADSFNTQDMEALARISSDRRVVAWGEIGLDYFRLRSSGQNQREVFTSQLKTAREKALPVIIHDREAHDHVLEILRNMGRAERNGVIHCFSGDLDLAMKFIELGFFISIPGTVTYKKAAQTKEVAASIPLERLLVETDAPFLAPVPKRGKRNEPLFVNHTAGKIAELRGMDVQALAEATSANAIELFGLS